MYRILIKMKKFYNHQDWMWMVEQAHERGKLTDQEYQELINLKEEEEA